MAVEVESTSQVEEFLGLFKRRLAWILHPALLMLSLGVAVAVVIPKKFVTSTKVLVRDNSSSGSGPASSSLDSTSEARMAGFQIRSLNRIQAVLLDLGWPEFTEIGGSERLEYVKKVRENVDVDVPNTPGSAGQVIVTVKYAHTDPQRAFDFLTELVEKWKSEVLERGINAETTAFNKLKERKLNLEQEQEDLTDQLTALQKEYHIPVAAPSARGNSEVQAPVFDKIAKQQTELDQVLLDISLLEAQLATDREQLNRMPEMMAAPESAKVDERTKKIEKLTESILKYNQEIRDKRYKRAHSRYIILHDKIEDAQQEIRLLQEAPTEVLASIELIPNLARQRLQTTVDANEATLEQLETRRDGLTESLEASQAEASELQGVYAEITTLRSKRSQREAELEDVTKLTAQRLRAVQWVEGSGGNPFEVLEKVELPVVPSEPNPFLIVVVFLFLGCGLGVGIALLTEFTKNCFRTVGDVGRVMFVPVLGTINTIETQAQRNRRRFAALFVSGLSFGTVAILGFITWAWSARPELLSERVLSAIEGFRQNFL